MAVRTRAGVSQENGGGDSSNNVNHGVLQYCELPFAYDNQERQRDLAALDDGGVRMPSRQCALTVTVCFLIAVVLMPLLAISKPASLRTDIPWWKQDIVYKINVGSFSDGDSDGTGDINGIIQKLDYLESLGVKAIELESFYEGCEGSSRCGVVNHTRINPAYGTLRDMDELVQQLHDRDIKLLIPFIPNHSSSKHPWFMASQTGAGPFVDFYIWNQGVNNKPPNNWASNGEKSSWSLNKEKGHYYYHQYKASLPDLNYRNPNVVRAMNEVLQFWLDRGVDGIRIHDVEYLVESNDTRLNEPLLMAGSEELDHMYTVDQPESLNILSSFTNTIRQYAIRHHRHIPILVDLHKPSQHPQFWFSTYGHGGHMPRTDVLTSLPESTLSGRTLHTAVNSVMKAVPFDRGEHWLEWHTEDQSAGRVWSAMRQGLYMEAGLALTLLLPGTGFLYHGQEHGFVQHPTTTYQLQNAEATQSPLFPALKAMTMLRKEPAFMLGQHNPMIVNDNVYSFSRMNRGRWFPKYFISMNVGREASTDNYRIAKVTLKIPEDFMEAPIKLPLNGTIVYHSKGYAPNDSMVGQVVNIEALTLKPGQVLVVKL